MKKGTAYLIFDADSITDPRVGTALIRLKKNLKQEGVVVKLGMILEGGGVGQRFIKVLRSLIAQEQSEKGKHE